MLCMSGHEQGTGNIIEEASRQCVGGKTRLRVRVKLELEYLGEEVFEVAVASWAWRSSEGGGSEGSSMKLGLEQHFSETLPLIGAPELRGSSQVPA